MDKIFIHYGADQYDYKMFHKIKNTNWIKPSGGLWASPIDSQFGWKDWCDSEGYKSDLSKNFTFTLAENARIYVVDSYHDLSKCPTIRPSKSMIDIEYIDFEKMAMQYDAMYLTEEGQWRTRLSHPMNLYGWDCESILIMNKEIIIKHNHQAQLI